MLTDYALVQPEVFIFLAHPGTLVENADGWHHRDRRLRYEVGSNIARSLDELRALLAVCDREARAVIDPRKGVNVQETIRVMEVALQLGFEVSFAGTQEQD